MATHFIELQNDKRAEQISWTAVVAFFIQFIIYAYFWGGRIFLFMILTCVAIGTSFLFFQNNPVDSLNFIRFILKNSYLTPNFPDTFYVCNIYEITDLKEVLPKRIEVTNDRRTWKQ